MMSDGTSTPIDTSSDSQATSIVFSGGDSACIVLIVSVLGICSQSGIVDVTGS
jgi:hypothetical protein